MKITLRPNMSKYQIQRQLEKAFKSAIDNSHYDWTCAHGIRHRIRIGSIHKGAEHRLHCGCTVTGR